MVSDCSLEKVGQANIHLVAGKKKTRVVKLFVPMFLYTYTVEYKICILRKQQQEGELIRDFPYVLFKMKKMTKEIV